MVKPERDEELAPTPDAGARLGILGDEMDRDLSCVAGSIESPLLEITIGQALDSAAERWGDRDAIVSAAQRIRWTWRDLAYKADAMAAGFLAIGLEPGDRIGIWSPDSGRMGPDSVRGCEDWPGADDHQSRAPYLRVRVHAKQDRDEGCRSR